MGRFPYCPGEPNVIKGPLKDKCLYKREAERSDPGVGGVTVKKGGCSKQADKARAQSQGKQKADKSKEMGSLSKLPERM